METIYYTATETAKIIRQALKAEFPGVKFSVRKRSYHAITVEANIGRELAQKVEAFLHNYRGADFDGMTDSLDYVRHIVDGKQVSYGANFIFVEYDRKAA